MQGVFPITDAKWLIARLGNRTNTLVKTRSPKLNSIDVFAPAQGFSSHLAFFDNAKRWQTTPDQEIQLPECVTYLIARVDICRNALAKESRAKLNSIDWFAPGQCLCVLLVFGGVFSTVFACLLSVIEKNLLQLPSEIKSKTKSLAWERFAH